MLGVQKDGVVQVYEGLTHGIIVPPRGDGWGFAPVFQPTGRDKTLAEGRPDEISARYKAVQNLVEGNLLTTHQLITYHLHRTMG